MATANERVQKRISECARTHNIISTCNWEHIPEMHRLLTQEVCFDPDPKAGDVYLHKSSKKWIPHHQGMLLLESAAQVQWDPTQTRPLEQNRDYVLYQATGFVVVEMNQPKYLTAHAEMDINTLREVLEEEYANKVRYAKGKQREWMTNEWAKDSVARDVRYNRTHKIKLAATSARNTVIQKLLHLKSGYSAEEIRRPFLVIRCVVAPDLSSPEMQQRITEMSLAKIAGGNGLFTPPALPAAPAAPPVEAMEAEVVEPEELTFEEMDPDTQIAILQDLVKRKDYDMDAAEVPFDIESLNERQRNRFYDVLNKMPDA